MSLAFLKAGAVTLQMSMFLQPLSNSEYVAMANSAFVAADYSGCCVATTTTAKLDNPHKNAILIPAWQQAFVNGRFKYVHGFDYLEIPLDKPTLTRRKSHNEAKEGR